MQIPVFRNAEPVLSVSTQRPVFMTRISLFPVRKASTRQMAVSGIS